MFLRTSCSLIHALEFCTHFDMCIPEKFFINFAAADGKFTASLDSLSARQIVPLKNI
jgi:hypothetical protein